ncbi:TetR/AcrR family transcriptional regulator [Gordonia sp. TBRC 11910]|uniref:TetR/AcrR family transcriptional regulator n=1 Tax=Gordonia asplenii TaxID=2725283 RepID=A0A848L275_9ACTN|nr:TetR/AcrR family transcriptional regulator [Gordonia asplenii]NMO05120.1 TetR/AcrR family transcriptional regulator [Gordonia asplenii]
MRSAPTFTETARRAQLVGCAIDAIAELGYGKASVRKIAERADVAMSVVLYHFGNKDELVTAVVGECYRSLVAAMLPVVSAADGAAAKLAAHIRCHIDYIDTHRGHQLALMEIANNFRTGDGRRLHEAGLQIPPELLADLATIELDTILADGVESGEFRSLPTTSLALAIRSAIGGAMLPATADPDFDVRAYGEDLVHTFLLATQPTQT